MEVHGKTGVQTLVQAMQGKGPFTPKDCKVKSDNTSDRYKSAAINASDHMKANCA